MMERNGGVIRSVAWKEVFPWLCIFKTFRLAIGFRALVMGALAVLLMATGWAIFGRMFDTDAPSTHWLQEYGGSNEHSGCPWKALTDNVPNQPILLGQPEQPLVLGERTATNVEPISQCWSTLSQPLWSGFGLDVTLGNSLCLVCCGLWSLAIWAFFGAAITRIAAVQLAANERITWGAALRYSCSKYLAFFFAPLGPLVGIGLAVVPVLVFAWLLRFAFGTMIAGFLWPIFLVFGLVISLLLLGLIFGWPLMFPTISTEGTDSFDALSRSYAYVFQRPLHYLFYAVVAALFGWLGWLLVRNFASSVVWTTYWAASWDAGPAKIQALIDMKTTAGEPLTGMTYAGAWLIHFWTGVVKLLAVGFLFSYFWNASTAIYLLLRRNVDATEMDEVSLDADEGEAKFGLPKIVLDDAGAPAVEEKPAAKPTAEEKEPPKPAAEEKAHETPLPPVGGEPLTPPSP